MSTTVAEKPECHKESKTEEKRRMFICWAPPTEDRKKNEALKFSQRLSARRIKNQLNAIGIS